jgi:DNA-binding LytR/AlgR family response regulator
MVKIAICDDEKNIRAYLSALVKKQGIECEITEYATAGDYFADGVEHDILFLDIELEGPGQDMDGMEMARQIRGMEDTKQPIIIFITGYEKYVYDAFDVGAFQYLLKPVDEQKFAEVFRRAAEQAAAYTEQDKKVLMIQYGGTGKTIPLRDIYYMESQNHKIAVHMKDGVPEYYARMSDLEEELQGQFCRVHKGYLINLSYVDEYNKTEVTLTNGDKLLISKYKYEDFVKAYLHFMQ